MTNNIEDILPPFYGSTKIDDVHNGETFSPYKRGGRAPAGVYLVRFALYL